MGKRVIFLLACFAFCAAVLLAQDVPVGVIVALKKGSREGLTRYVGETMDLTIGSESGSKDRETALNEIAAFWETNKVEGFDVKHEGKRDESSFIVGTLKTVNGNFRVNCFFRRVGNRYVIPQIRIDKIND